MAIRQHKGPTKRAAEPVVAPTSSSSGSEEEPTDVTEEDLEALEEEEFHTEDEDEDEDEEDNPEAENGAIADDELHMASEDDSGGIDNSLALPAAILKSKPTARAVPVQIQWDKLTRSEKKSLRDDMGLSMKELKAQAQDTGVIEAGRAAQNKRGVRPADRVAGSRVTKKRRRKTKQPKLEVSGKQKLIQARKESAAMSGRGSLHPVKKRKR